MIKNEYLDEKDVEEFRTSGLLWFTNTILHAFGWALVAIRIKDYDGNEKNILLPARTKFRGFDVTANDRGYRRLSEYMLQNAQSIRDDAFSNEEEEAGNDSEVQD